MKIKFVLKAKDLNKKWLKSVKSLYGKQKLVISIEPDSGDETDFDFDDDSWWGDDEDDFALEIDNTVDEDFNAEEYLASIEKQLAEEAAKETIAKSEETPVKVRKPRTPKTVVETPVEEAPVTKNKGGRPKKVVAETPVEEAPVKVKNKGGRPKKKTVAETKEEAPVTENIES